jgi:hypothetical protein
VILRVLAALALLLGAAALMAFLNVVGKGPFAGPEARHLRAMKDRTAAPARIERIDVAGFRALPHHRPLAEVAAIERRGVVLEGRVQRILWASDDDVHLEVAPPDSVLADPKAIRLVPYVSAEITPPVRRRHPGWGYDALAAALKPNLGTATPWPGGPARARVTGWLLYDFQYDESFPESALRERSVRLTGWEIHPVTRLEVWDDARGAWSEVGP